MNKKLSEKVVALSLVIAVLGIGVSLFTYIQVAIGAGVFNGPTASPPSGTGILSVDALGTTLSVNGLLDLLSNRITGVSDPSLDSDAVNKAYADALGSGGGIYQMYCGFDYNYYLQNGMSPTPADDIAGFMGGSAFAGVCGGVGNEGPIAMTCADVADTIITSGCFPTTAGIGLTTSVGQSLLIERGSNTLEHAYFGGVCITVCQQP